MDTIVAVAYVSSAVRELTETELEALLVSARAFNLTQQVTGTLLHHDGTFFQYFEGPVDGVEAVYARVKASQLHRGLVELLRESVRERQFKHWSMGFSAAPQNLMLQLERARWSKLSKQLEAQTAPSAGLALLLQFWRSSLRSVD